ncbi:polyprenyl synthetase family protein [Gilvimarinus sp. F26214L]|uniref:polyprenyl synthetase family protein n=1 Tax=Gilvimarinus sp. DZF01 TaxID=3461371 RepID=UPI00404587C5
MNSGITHRQNQQQDQHQSLKAAIELELERLLPKTTAPPFDLHRAMHYALLAPGKRLRPLLTLFAAGDENPSPDLLRIACVSELVHTASLILDDLPCMDDAKLRRNRPCTHLAFSESTAILTAMALLNMSYGVIAGCRTLAPGTRTDIVTHLTKTVGSMGLVGGQIADLQNSCGNNSATSARSVEQLYYHKTGVLFEFATVTGGRMRGLSGRKLTALGRFARAFGFLFQIRDDLLDQDSSAEKAGKDVGKDADKATLLSLESPQRLESTISTTLTMARQQLADAGLESSELKTLVEQSFAFGLERPGVFATTS